MVRGTGLVRHPRLLLPGTRFYEGAHLLERASELGQERLNSRMRLGFAGDLRLERGLSLMFEKTQTGSFLK